MKLGRTRTERTTSKAGFTVAGLDGRIVTFYLLAFAAGGIVQPFLNIYLAEAGLSGAQIGLLHGVTAGATILIMPFIGVLADRSQRHRLLLRLMVALKGLLPALIPLSNAWLWLLFTAGGRVLAAQAHDAILNQLTLGWLRQRGRRNFGSVRFWGSLSFAATSLLAGWLARDRSLTVLFPLAGATGLAAVFFVGGFPQQLAARRGAKNPAGLLLSKNAVTRRSPLLLFLFVVIFLFTLGKEGPYTFAYVYLKKGLGAGTALIGLLGAITSLAPLLAFYIADRLIQARGPATTMATAFFLFAITWGGYAIITTPLLAVPLAFLLGFANALFMVGMVVAVGDLGRPEQGATDQMLAQLAVPGLAAVVAQPASGGIYDAFGGPLLFALDAVVVLLAAVLLLLVIRRQGETRDVW